MQNKFKQYADLKFQMKVLEDSIKSLQGSIIEEVESNPEAGKEFGVFTVVKKTKWIYSSKIQKMKEDIKLKEIDEQDKGIAVEEEQAPFLTFRSYASSRTGH
jgi:hypothetical protein